LGKRDVRQRQKDGLKRGFGFRRGRREEGGRRKEEGGGEEMRRGGGMNQFEYWGRTIFGGNPK
jgi:hypothetical protein